MTRPTGYEPLYTLKPVAPDVWIADGGWIRFYGLPFPTRMTVVRLACGGSGCIRRLPIRAGWRMRWRHSARCGT